MRADILAASCSDWLTSTVRKGEMNMFIRDTINVVPGVHLYGDAATKAFDDWCRLSDKQRHDFIAWLERHARTRSEMRQHEDAQSMESCLAIMRVIGE